jgi:hypothetical protein
MVSRLSPDRRRRELRDAYRFPGCLPERITRDVGGDPGARVILLSRRAKKTICGASGTAQRTWYDRRRRRVRDLPCGDL